MWEGKGKKERGGTGGSLQHSHDPLAGFKGYTSKGREGCGRERGRKRGDDSKKGHFVTFQDNDKKSSPFEEKIYGDTRLVARVGHASPQS